MRRSKSLLNNLAETAIQPSAGMQQPFANAPHPHSPPPANYEMPFNQQGYGQPHTGQPPVMYPEGTGEYGQQPPQPNPYHSENAFPQAGSQHQPFAKQPAPQAPELQNVKATLDGLANRLNTLAKKQASQAATAANPPSSAAASTEISNLSEAIGNLQLAIADIKSSPGQAEELAALRAGIEQIQEDISTRVIAGLDTQIDPSAYAQAVENSHQSILGEIRNIQIAVEQNSSAPQLIADTLHARQNDLVSRLDEITASLAKLDDYGALEETVALREQLTRLDASFLDFASNFQEPADNSDLSERLDEITRGILALSTPDSSIDNLERIEARMMDLSRDLKQLAGSSGQTEPAFDIKQLEPFFEQILSSIRACEERLAGIEERENTDNGYEKLAADISGLSDRIGNLSMAALTSGDGAPIAAEPALLERLDALVNRVEGLKTDNSQLENAKLQFESLEQQVNEISQQLDAMATGYGQSPEVIERLDTLVERFDRMGASGDGAQDNSLINALHERISVIAENLENRVDDESEFPQLNERLDGIEKQLGASRDISIEVAAGAAEEAVKSVVDRLQSAGSGLEHSTVVALLEDIRTLKESGIHSDKAGQLDDIKLNTTLDIISNRLDSIEHEIEKLSHQPATNRGHTDHAGFQAASEIQEAQQPAVLTAISSGRATLPVENVIPESPPDSMVGAVLVKAAREAEQERRLARKGYEESFAAAHAGEKDEDVYSVSSDADLDPERLEDFAMPEVVAPELASDDLPEVSSDEINERKRESDEPIEPGSAGPDLAALVRQANDRRKALSEKGDGNGGTDFLAAARRAAQAAAVEADEASKERGEVGDSSGLLASIREALSNHKKPVVVASAALLVAVISVPFISKYLTSSPQNQVQQTQISSEAEPIGQIAVDTSSDATGVNNTTVEPVTAAPEGEWEETEVASVEPDTPSITEEPPQAEENSFLIAPESIEVNLAKIDFAPTALKEAVAAKNPLALFEIARRFTNGVGTEKDLSEAARWYEKAASLGVVPAQYVIGNFNEKGIGVAADRSLARAWYEEAANSGHVVSMHNLGVMSASPDPETGENDFKEAISWFKKAAEYGVRDSQVNLGIFLAKGSGGEIDLIESYKWFSIASRSGDPDASQKRDFVANALRPDQLEEAKARADNWKELTPDPSVNEVQIPDSWKSQPSTVSLTDKDSIARTQSLLSNAGFDVGPADGVIGKRTRNAIVEFRTRMGLPVNDRIDEELLSALEAVAT